MNVLTVVQQQWVRRIEAEYVSSVYAQDHARRLTAGGAAVTAVDPALIALPEPSDVLTTLITDTVMRFCLAETLAVRLFRLLHDTACAEPARAVLGQVVADEPRHAALGWTTLDWLLAAYGDPTRSIVHRIRDDAIAALGRAHSAPAQPLTRTEREWGLVCPSEYTREFETTVTRDFLPRFARRGL